MRRADEDPRAELRERIQQQIRDKRVTALDRPDDEALPAGSGTTIADRPWWSRLWRWLSPRRRGASE